ncbi:MAG: outer membrane lipid asymmetry maintenance protein MlaD [Rhodospirillales bacterium]
MRRNLIETLTGAVVLAVAVVFLIMAYSRADLAPTRGYTLVARFDRVDGLKDGSDVRVSGIKVGSVAAQELDPKTFLAVVRMTVEDAVKLPKDTSASITSDGLLGDKYIALSPGGAEDNLQPGGEITFTQGSIDVVGLIGQYVFSQSGSSSGGDKSKSEPPKPDGP